MDIQYPAPNATTDNFKRPLKKKSYELKDHLGNVRMVISDMKLASPQSVWPISVQEYYPFGMLQPERNHELQTNSQKNIEAK